MAIEHRFIDELENLEQNQIFFNSNINQRSNILFIGTFNPNNQSCEKHNNASWFYGRNQSKFWRYMPQALTGISLHPNDGHIGHPTTWKNYCVENRIVIIDLIKRINIDDILPNFGDDKVECKINHDLTNTEIFNVRNAFQGVQFNKVIYSLLWSDNKLIRMKEIRDIINESLLENGCILNMNQIKYCKTPSRNDAFPSWDVAINS